jgi:DUF2933 family protein
MAEQPHDKHAPGGGGTRRWVFLGFVLIAGYFLLTEHRAHVVQYLPFALLLACPLLHMFHGHGGHGGHGGGDKRDKTDERPSS